MLNFKPKEFMDVMVEIRDELRAVRKLLEEQARPRYIITTPDYGEWQPPGEPVSTEFVIGGTWPNEP